MVVINTDANRISELVKEIQNGNEKAFDELYKLTNQRAYYVALEFVKKDEDAQDILQESYVKALSKIKELDKPESFQSWLNQIVANKSKDFLKKKKPMLFEAEENEVFEVLPDEDMNFRPESSLDQNELQRTVMEVLDELNEEKRACVLMMYFEELSVSEIAQTLEIPEGTVKTRLFSARKDLKEKFSKRGITSAYSVAPIGVVLWAMRKSCITAGAAFAASEGSATVLASVSAASASTAATASTATTAATAVTAKASGGIGAKIMAMSLAKKIVAGVAAVAVIGGTTAGVVTVTKNAENKSGESNAPANNIVESVTENEYADDYYTDGYFTYTLDGNNNATIVVCDPSLSGEAVIPSELDGHKVVGLGCTEIGTTDHFSEVTINEPEEVIEILKKYSNKIGAFSKCTEITSIKVPECIETIEIGAFVGCGKLTRIDVDANNPNYSSDENGVLFSKDKKTLIIYPSASPTTAYSMPESVTNVEMGAFFGCLNIDELKLSPNIEETNYFNFYLSEFDTIVIPEGVEKINYLTFYFCNYNKMYLPKSLTHIDYMSTVSYDISGIYSGNANSEFVETTDAQRFYAGSADELKGTTITLQFDDVFDIWEEDEIDSMIGDPDGFIINTPAPY